MSVYCIKKSEINKKTLFSEKHCFTTTTHLHKMLALVLVAQVVLCVHARSYDNIFDVKRMIEKIDSIQYDDSYYTGKSATRTLTNIEKYL